jgi:hypothetical protein
MSVRPHTRTYEVYCGNYDCPTRTAGRTFTVTEGADLVDGEVWLCAICRAASVDVDTKGRT